MASEDATVLYKSEIKSMIMKNEEIDQKRHDDLYKKYINELELKIEELQQLIYDGKLEKVDVADMIKNEHFDSYYKYIDIPGTFGDRQYFIIRIDPLQDKYNLVCDFKNYFSEKYPYLKIEKYENGFGIIFICQKGKFLENK